MIGSIEEESERLYRLVEDLLAIARADLSEHLEMEPTAIEPVVQRVVTAFANRHPSRQIETRIEAALPPVGGEATYIQQVVSNLITNADKYSPTDQPIQVDVSSDGESVAIRVLDRGPGVAPEELNQIFESFYRSRSTARMATGKGLGLTVCKRLVEAMSGRIWAKLRPGGGLEVGFSLPITDAVEEDSQPPIPEETTA
jgi:two-component system sensor histidine kinase KdpD